MTGAASAGPSAMLRWRVSRVSLEAASHVVAGDGWPDKLQPGGWPAYTCNKPPNPTDGRDRQWLIASHSGGSAPPEKPASSFSRRATPVGEVKPERQSNKANTKSVAPQHSYAVGFLPPGPRSARLVQGICWTPPRSTCDPRAVSLTMAGPGISPWTVICDGWPETSKQPLHSKHVCVRGMGCKRKGAGRGEWEGVG